MKLQQKILLAASLLAIFILLLVSQFIQPKQISAADISEDNLNQLVKLEGKITSQRNYEGKDFQILIFQDDSGKIDVTANAKSRLELNFSKTYIITGKVEEYEDSLQVSANKIEAIG